MKPQYEPKTLGQFLGYTVEECGEVLAAIGKSQRWGLTCYNPEVPIDVRELNYEWILREIVDLRGALDRLEAALNAANIEDQFDMDWIVPGVY